MLRLKESEGKLCLEASIDDHGYVMTNVQCPIHCGVCCDYWKEVVELATLAARYPDQLECPNLRDDGCRLKRRDRPIQCKAHLCELGMLAYNKQVTQEQILRTVDAGAQEYAFRFLGISIPTKNGAKSELKFRGKDEYKLKKLLKRRNKLCEQNKKQKQDPKC